MTPKELSAEEFDRAVQDLCVAGEEVVHAHIAALEADNAALLQAGEQVHALASHDEACKMLVGSEFAMCDCSMGEWQQIQREPHPGAHLLAEHAKAVATLTLARDVACGMHEAAQKARLDEQAEHAKALVRAMHNGLQRAKSAVKTAASMGLIGSGPADRLSAMVDAMKEPES